MGERSSYEPGTFCLVGLATSDPERATAFYTSLFDWQAEERTAEPAGAYTMLRRDGRDVAALYRQTPEARSAGAAPHWTSYVSVEDADATAELVGRLGGAVVREPLDMGDAARVAAIADPSGAIVSLWQPRSHAGAALVNDVGALCWNELVTPDVESAQSFFAGLFGWEFRTDEGGYAWIRNAGRPNGGIREPTAPERGLPPNWMPYFTVENAEDGARRAMRADGRGVVAPTDVPIGRFAILTDPQGAAFAVFEGDTDP
jgi:uncharacterized protein